MVVSFKKLKKNDRVFEIAKNVFSADERKRTRAPATTQEVRRVLRKIYEVMIKYLREWRNVKTMFTFSRGMCSQCENIFIFAKYLKITLGFL